MSKPLGLIRYEGNRYVLADGKWSGPDADVAAILNSLFRLSTHSRVSCAVLPTGYECIRAAAKWAKDGNPVLPRFQGDHPGQIH